MMEGEARNVDQHKGARGINMAQVQSTGEGRWAGEQEWFEFEEPILEQCGLGPLRAWDKFEEPGKKSTSFRKNMHLEKICSGEIYTDFFFKD